MLSLLLGFFARKLFGEAETHLKHTLPDFCTLKKTSRFLLYLWKLSTVFVNFLTCMKLWFSSSKRTWSCSNPIAGKPYRSPGADTGHPLVFISQICDMKTVNRWKIKQNDHYPRFFRMFPGDTLITQLYQPVRGVSRILSQCEPPCRSLPFTQGWPRASYSSAM